MSLSLSLPPPRNHHHNQHRNNVPPSAMDDDDDKSQQQPSQQQQQQKQQQKGVAPQRQNQKQQRKSIPSYEERCRAALRATKERKRGNKQKAKLFVPRSLEDFADGGAYPEIHVAQYPRHMGNPHLKKKKIATATNSNAPNKNNNVSGIVSKSRALATVEIDEKGDVSYDAIVKSGTNSSKKVYTKHDDLRPSFRVDPEDASNPTEEEEEDAARKTESALAALLGKQTELDKPSGTALQNIKASENKDGENTKFIKYIPKKDAPGYNPTASTRVIQMVPAQIDPMMPPKHKHVKAPRGPAEDPVPVLHAPVTTKLTKEERDSWNIPACISNWKNTRGYTIPLDKRLAADGRALREDVSINSHFATLSESLYVAERQARQEVRMRSQVQKKLLMAEKEQREKELRDLANQARIQRTQPTMADSNNDHDKDIDDDNNHDDDTNDDDDRSSSRNGKKHPQAVKHEEDEEEPKAHRIETDEDVAARQREKLRMERKKERDRELRRENNSFAAEQQKQKQQKLGLEKDRDVSEKIALGTFTGNGGGNGGSGDVDARLYNQTGGMDSGFGREDEYNTYTKPLFGGSGAGGGVSSASIYRPTRGETEFNADEQYASMKQQGMTSKFQPDKGFSGAEGGVAGGAGGQSRTAPVQFEKGTRHK